MDNFLRNVATVQCNTDKQYILSTELSDSNNHFKDINTSYCQPSNLIPHFWYYRIVDKEGNPDLPCIMILSEIFGWFRSLSESQTYYSTSKSLPELVNGQLAISYDYLSDKLNFKKERIRKKLVILESLRILTRDVRNIALEDGSRINQLYISINQKFFLSCFRDPELDIRVRTNEADIVQSPDFKPSPHLGGEHISKKNKNRSMKSVFSQTKNRSNFISNNLEEKELETTQLKVTEEYFSTKKTMAEKGLVEMKKAKKLKDFYPLSEEDCNLLQSKSGRKFSLNAMNEILQDMSEKLILPEFWSKKGFVAYMSKAFSYELRNEIKVSNENFKIKNNYSEADKQEEFLSEIENTLQVSPEWHLKKKLANVLKAEKAYQLLKSCKRMEASREGGIFQIHLNRYIELSQLEKEIILNQVRATHEKMEDGEYKAIEEIEFVMPKKQITKNINSKTSRNSKLPDGIWGKIRSVLIEYNGSSGQAIDSHWISKLDAEIDERSKRIKLRAPSVFIKDWVQGNYQQSIDLLVRNSGFELESLSC